MIRRAVVPPLVLLFAAAACDGGGGEPDGGGPDGSAPPDLPPEVAEAYCGEGWQEVEARITELLADLTLAEKVELMYGESISPVGGSWLVTGTERLDIPGLHMLDGPRGLSRSSGRTGTVFPVAMMRGATWDPELERLVGQAIAREVRSVGADVLLAPTINILRHPRWGRAQETYSEDVHHMAEMAVAFVGGVQSEGVIACAKHFAANSIEDTRHEVDVLVEERALREVYLPHFRRVVDEAAVGAVMSAYNQLNGHYCDLHAELLQDILKGEWQFLGFVVSDWYVGTHGDVDAVRAGLDIEMPTGSYFRRLAVAVDEGDLDESAIDASVRRILRAQLCYGLDERERTLDDPDARETDEHTALALEVARRGIVLLRNEPADGATAPAPAVLPLDRSEVTSLVVLGRVANVDNIGDIGSSAVLPSDVVTAFEGLVEGAGGGVEVTLIESEELSAEEETLVGAADAALVVTGLTEDDEGEGDLGPGDREGLGLPHSQVDLIRDVAALNPVTIVILEAGAALAAAEWIDEVEALLLAFYPGQQGGQAISEVVFGDQSPSGRLPFSMPVDEADLPAFDNVSESVTYDLWHGYRHLEREGASPLFPFGAGLCYTTFDYDGLTLASDAIPPDGVLEVGLVVTNAGEVAGRETVQLYVAALGSRVERAPQELRAFTQVELDPGASATVDLEVPARSLAFYDVAAAAWEVEAIEYEVRVGASSGDIRLTATFRVE